MCALPIFRTPHDAFIGYSDLLTEQAEVFFFSSRRRHTRLQGDWSSDVCSSDLLALGISGGLVPCPSALVVMLSAISLGRVGFGLLLIVAFSVGLAGALTAVGLLFVYGGRWLNRLSRGRVQHSALRLLPIASALVVTTAGVVITAQAVAQAGLLR